MDQPTAITPSDELSIREGKDLPGFHQVLGYRQVSWSENEAVIKLDVQPCHLNMAGVLHGGVITALLDVVLAEAQRLVDTTLQTWGRIDVLVCNAATNPVYGPTSELTDDAWDKIMDTNVKGAFWRSNMVLPQMAERGEGAVIMLSSIAGLRGNMVIGTYGVSKAAEAALAHNLAAEWVPKGIRASAYITGQVIVADGGETAC